jgi:hypothetical protein
MEETCLQSKLRVRIEPIRKGEEMARSSISYLWRDPKAQHGFRTGVSLHSHTNQSVEPLSFLAKFSAEYPAARILAEWLERRSPTKSGSSIHYASAYWTPPLSPRQAFDLEREQIENLGLESIVSITDHDSIHAPMQLSTMPGSRQIPISLEWSVPYDEQSFHLGVHNLPIARASQWMRDLAAHTANPTVSRLIELLAALNAEPEVFVVFNHPMWDLYLIGRKRHQFLINEFLQKVGGHLHALELNGLRNWQENRATLRLAEKWNMQLVSGGDRHGLEPSANINLTHASTFTEFVQEVRRKRVSDMLFLPQYAEPWKLRMMQSAIDIVRYYPSFPRGSRAWDERFYHPNDAGAPRPLRELWLGGKAPWAIRASIRLFQMMERRPVSGPLRMVWSDADQLQLALGEHDS